VKATAVNAVDRLVRTGALAAQTPEPSRATTTGVLSSPALMAILVVTADAPHGVEATGLAGADGFATEQTGDVHRGLMHALTRRFDVVVIDDRELPGLSGLELVRRMRGAQVATPVLMLTPGASVDRRVAGLRAGADDCLASPFAPAELQARIRALHRRSRRREAILPLGAACVDLRHRVVRYVDGRQIELTARECALLAALGAEPGKVISHERLHAEVFPAAESRSIAGTYVYYLRRKLGRQVIETVHSVGYRLGCVPFAE
jgi:two-component system response regulator QseB